MNKITLYPSNWLYNAGVVGFLKVVEEEMGKKKVEEIISNGLDLAEFFHNNYEIDGLEILIPKALGLSINYLYNHFYKSRGNKKKNYEKGKEMGTYIIKLKIGKKEKRLERKLFKKLNNEEKEKEFLSKFLTVGDRFFVMKNKGYIQRLDWVIENKYTAFLQAVPLVYKSAHENFVCFQCSRVFGKTSKTDEKFFEIMTNYSSGTAVNIAASIAEFPNSFWNIARNIKICPLCSFFSVHYSIGLVLFNEYRENKRRVREEIFINTPDFLLTYELNKFAKEILEKQKEYEMKKILGSSLLQWALKKKTTLGAWTLTNIEVVIKKEKEIREPRRTDIIIDYFDLPYHITRILLDYEVANLIKRINEEKIFDLIVSGKFSELEKANYFALRSILKLKNNQQISENDPITKYISNYRDLKHLQDVSTLLPELYTKIIKILKQTKGGL